jgi:predicted nucleic acid-binding Zn ribbon protein
VSLKTALEKALKTPAIRKHVHIAGLREKWETLVGSDIARHIQPVSLERGILTLEADSSVWRQQVLFLKPQLLDLINNEFSRLKIRDLRVK